MRTTLTLDPEVAAMLKAEAYRTHKPFKRVVNDAIRAGLSPRLSRAEHQSVSIEVHHAQLLPGIDAASLNRLSDDLEEEVFVSALATKKR